MHYLLIYEVSDDYLERRGQYRDEHLRLAWQAHEREELVLGGALAEPADGAVLLFSTDSAEKVAEFAHADPYVVNGLVTSWKVRAWTTVIGDMAATPVRPASDS